MLETQRRHMMSTLDIDGLHVNFGSVVSAIISTYTYR